MTMDARRTYLFVTWEGGGNVPPVLGTVRRLAARGHAVRVLTEPCLEQAVRQAGAGEHIGSRLTEGLIAAGLLSLALAMLALLGIVLWGLRGGPDAVEPQETRATAGEVLV
jgi:UDP:flavonoid glycosyltransferase YjiC (YdhE family)